LKTLNNTGQIADGNFTKNLEKVLGLTLIKKANRSKFLSVLIYYSWLIRSVAVLLKGARRTNWTNSEKKLVGLLPILLIT